MNALVERLASHHQRIESWMKVLLQRQLWQDLWQPTDSPLSFKIGLLLIAHVIAPLEPSTLVNDADCAEMQNLWEVKGALTGNTVVCEMMEALWNDLPGVAACISSETLLHMATHLQGIHPNIVNPGFKKFLQMKFELPTCSPCESSAPPTASSSSSPSPTPEAVKEASDQFVDLVNDIKHLDLDAGHWHELWEEGESIGLCIILHYIKHEKRSRLEQLGRIRNVNACINSNIKKIRDGLAATPGMMEELIRLWKRRPDITAQLDGNTLQLLVAELRVNLACAKRCFAHICKKLPETWAVGCGSAENPSAYLYTCVYNFIHSKGGQKDKSSRRGDSKSHRSSSGSIKSSKSDKSGGSTSTGSRRSSASSIGALGGKSERQGKKLQEHHSAPEALTPLPSRSSTPLPSSPLSQDPLSSAPLSSAPLGTISPLGTNCPLATSGPLCHSPLISSNTPLPHPLSKALGSSSSPLCISPLSSHHSMAPSDSMGHGERALQSFPSQSSRTSSQISSQPSTCETTLPPASVNSHASPSAFAPHELPFPDSSYLCAPDSAAEDRVQPAAPVAIRQIESWLQQVWANTCEGDEPMHHSGDRFGSMAAAGGMVAVA